MGRAMKDSGVEWIGEIPEDWEVVPHKYVMHKEKSICDHYSGEQILSLTLNGVIIRDLDAGGKMPTTFDGYQYIKSGDLLLCLFDIDVTPRCVGLVKNDGITSPAYSRFIVHPGFLNSYYDYLLRALDDKKVFVPLSKNLRNSLTETDFGAIKTIVPPLHEQEIIAMFLDKKCAEIDSIIVQTRASIEEYKHLKQAVITQAVTKGVRGDRPMRDSRNEIIGAIPSDWQVQKMTYISEKIGDGLHGTPQFSDEGVASFINGNNLGNAHITIKDSTSKVSEEEAAKYLVPLNRQSLLISLNGTIGKLSYYNGEKIILGKSAGYINLIPGINKYFICYYLQSSVVSLLFELSFAGTTIKNLSLETLRNLTIIYPPVDEQKQIVAYLDKKCAEIDALIAKKEQLLTELESYKKSLIYEYATGKKAVPVQ
ncbi:MAG: restriction endonuclease subunit S [Clostridiales bacterium]|nr:restriction endonuclease subunit S [Clostridiales bacterium]